MNVKLTKAFFMVLISFGYLFFLPKAIAQGTPLACQVEAAGGLIWDKGMWKSTSFEDRKFILVLEGSNLQNESASKVMLNAPTICVNTFKANISCTTEFGLYLFFDRETMHGTVGMLKADNGSSKRDTISVEAFVCQRF